MSENPRTSTRRLSLELQLSRSSVQRLLRDSGLKSYRTHLVQGLSEDDFDRRVQCCEELLQPKADDNEFFEKIIWTDEAQFKLNGSVNHHNTVYYASENPHVMVEKHVNSPGVIVCAEMSCKGFVGPFFFPSTVTGESYTTLLETAFYPSVANWPDLNEFWFQHDGAPAHYSKQARQW